MDIDNFYVSGFDLSRADFVCTWFDQDPTPIGLSNPSYGRQSQLVEFMTYPPIEECSEDSFDIVLGSSNRWAVTLLSILGLFRFSWLVRELIVVGLPSLKQRLRMQDTLMPS